MTSPLRGFEPGLWTPVFALLRHLDDDIAALYVDRGMAEVRPRFAAAVLELAAQGPRTIRALADGTGVTHSAMSQTVAAMRSAGLVESAAGTDGRTRLVRLTARGDEVSTFVRAEWDATEAAVAELEAEITYPLVQVAADIAAAVARRPFRDRVAGHLRRG